MRPHRDWTARVVAVAPDIGLEGDIAEIVILDGLGAPTRDRIFGEAVQIVIKEGLGKALVWLECWSEPLGSSHTDRKCILLITIKCGGRIFDAVNYHTGKLVRRKHLT